METRIATKKGKNIMEIKLSKVNEAKLDAIMQNIVCESETIEDFINNEIIKKYIETLAGELESEKLAEILNDIEIL